MTEDLLCKSVGTNRLKNDLKCGVCSIILLLLIGVHILSLM